VSDVIDVLKKSYIIISMTIWGNRAGWRPQGNRTWIWNHERHRCTALPLLLLISLGKLKTFRLSSDNWGYTPTTPSVRNSDSIDSREKFARKILSPRELQPNSDFIELSVALKLIVKLGHRAHRFGVLEGSL
jgi:hypothetical protein